MPQSDSDKSEPKKSRQSPAVARIVAVLNFFVEHPQQAFTLTQVVRSLRLSRATTHAILVGLDSAGYLYRRPDKSYVLGPVLHALAASAERHFSPMTVASQEMRALADELDVVAAALFADGDEVVVRDRAASISHLGWYNPITSRYSMYPWGAAFLAPLSDAEVAARLDRARLGAECRDGVSQAVAFGRRYGFIVGLVPERERSTPEFPHPTARFLADLEGAGTMPVMFLEAPVMAGSEVAFAIALYGFGGEMSAAAVLEHGGRLRAACQRISNFISGRRQAA